MVFHSKFSLKRVFFYFFYLLFFNNNSFASWDSPNFITSQSPQAINKQQKLGDHVMHFINLSAMGLTIYKRDLEGFKQYALSAAVSGLTVSMLKFSSARYRPDLSNQDSFPSGHSSFAFSGASFIYDRYGAKLGIPAYILAAYVPYSRVASKKHHISDVIAGSILSLAVSKYFVKPYEKKISNVNFSFSGSLDLYNKSIGFNFLF